MHYILSKKLASVLSKYIYISIAGLWLTVILMNQLAIKKLVFFLMEINIGMNLSL